MSFLQDQGLFLASGVMKLSPKVTQLIGGSITLEHRSLNPGIIFFPLYYYIKGLLVFFQLDRASWRSNVFSQNHYLTGVIPQLSSLISESEINTSLVIV